jgi:hypothetical protein
MVTTQEKKMIPNEDNVYCYIHNANVSKTGTPRAAAFQNNPKKVIICLVIGANSQHQKKQKHE